jgi:hypothetical protein
MPSATPLPRGPSHLALFGAEDLLGRTGCPVCRYVTEAGDRFFGWFALEGHADASMITRLCESLGLCPLHTRGLLCQPGAAGRMTAVYRYLLQAALSYLATGTSPKAPCLACARDAESMDRVLDTLLTGLQDEDLRDRYRGAAGLCLPHLHAATARGGRQLSAWLAHDMTSRLAAGPPGLAVIAGDRDADAEMRVQLRATLSASPAFFALTAPTSEYPGFGDACTVCLTAAQAERDILDRVTGRCMLDHSWVGLCPMHLHEACSGIIGSARPMSVTGEMLALHAELSQAWLTELTAQPSLRAVFSPLTHRYHWRRGRNRGRRSSEDPGACPACHAWHDAANSAARRLPEILRAQPAASTGAHAPVLCLRHVITLRQQDPRSADAAVRLAVRRAKLLVRELEEAFRKQTWAHRHEPRGQEMTAWRRAAVLVDGRIYGGGPPGPL